MALRRSSWQPPGGRRAGPGLKRRDSRFLFSAEELNRFHVMDKFNARGVI
jgi:hypothetical protein